MPVTRAKQDKKRQGWADQKADQKRRRKIEAERPVPALLPAGARTRGRQLLQTCTVGAETQFLAPANYAELLAGDHPSDGSNIMEL